MYHILKSAYIKARKMSLNLKKETLQQQQKKPCLKMYLNDLTKQLLQYGK